MFIQRKYCFIVKCSSLCFMLVCFGSCARNKNNIFTPRPRYELNKSFLRELNHDVLTKMALWENGMIPYFIDDFSFDKVTRDKIRLYLGKVGSQTKLQFVELPRPPDDDKTRWVLFINRKGQLGCDDYYATKFTKEGVQKLVVGYDCLGDSGVGLAAAILALAGIPPEHNNPNRDDYIQIVQNNIMPDKLHLFQAVPELEWPFRKLVYDFNSASHYDFYKYSGNGHMTIDPKVPPPSTREGLSPADILKIRILYKSISQKRLINRQECSKMFRLVRGNIKHLKQSIQKKGRKRNYKQKRINPIKYITYYSDSYYY